MKKAKYNLKEGKPARNVLDQLLTKKNLTQSEAAKRIGISRGYLNRIIKHKVFVRLPMASKITRALRIPPGYVWPDVVFIEILDPEAYDDVDGISYMIP